MSLLAILDVMLGLIFLWLILSLAVIGIQEWIAARRRWRAQMLEMTLRSMLGDAALTDQFYNHPLIRSLYSGAEAEVKPSYIPADHFAQALFDIVVNSGSEASLLQQQIYALCWGAKKLPRRRRRAMQKRLNLILAMARRALVSATGEVPDETATSDLRLELQALADDFPAISEAVEHILDAIAMQREQMESTLAEWQRQQGRWNAETLLDRLKIGLVALGVTHPRLKQTLQALLVGVEEYTPSGESPLERAFKNVASWFENAMDRLSGWYKRRTQWMAFGLGCLLAFCLNADTLQLANQLWKAGALRSLLAQQALTLANQVELPPESALSQIIALQEQLSAFHLPLGWIEATEEACPSASPMMMVNDYRIIVAGRCYSIINVPLRGDITGWILKVFGWLMTALAAAQGAPFWFDVLKKIVNIRLAGGNPSEKGAWG